MLPPEPSEPYPVWISVTALAVVVALIPITILYGRDIAPWIIPGLMMTLLGFGALRGVRIYEVFVEGAVAVVDAGGRVAAAHVAQAAAALFADAGPTPDGGVQGRNSYTMWFEDDGDMSGTYCGYDGPCPPFNDERVHGYHFTVYALDSELDLPEGFDISALRDAMKGHILGQASLVGTYSTNV